MYICYEHSMYVSHIHIWRWYKSTRIDISLNKETMLFFFSVTFILIRSPCAPSFLPSFLSFFLLLQRCKTFGLVWSFSLTKCQPWLLPSWLGLEDTPTASLQRSQTPTNECPVYDTKQSDREVPVMIEFGECTSTPSLSSLPGPIKSQFMYKFPSILKQ